MKRGSTWNPATARRKLLDALKVGGPRSRHMVECIVGGPEAFERVVKPMLAAGELVAARGRGGRYGLPKDMR